MIIRCYIVVIFFVSLLVRDGSFIGRRTKRQQSLKIILNATIPCDDLEKQLMEENGGVPPRKIELNDDDLKELALMRGIKVASPFLPLGDPFSLLRFPGLSDSTLNPSGRPWTRSEIIKRIQTYRASRMEGSPEERSAEEEGAEGDFSKFKEIFPFVLPEDIGMNGTYRMSKTSACGLVYYEYCLERGITEMTVDGVDYVSMCTTCATTVYLPSNMWPRFVYGASCIQSDDKCLYAAATLPNKDAPFQKRDEDLKISESENSNDNDNKPISFEERVQQPNGRCVPNYYPVTVIRKSLNKDCVLVLMDGQRVIAEDWVQDRCFMDIGCHCAVSEQSAFN